MKFRCDCGHVIYDQTDSLPYKAGLLPDDGYWDNVHEPIVKGMVDLAESVARGDLDGWRSRNFGSGYPTDVDLESMLSDYLAARVLRGRTTYQCSACGAVFIPKQRGGEFVMFRPADDDWQNILSWNK